MTDASAPSFAREINEYWEERAHSYSNGVNGELADNRKALWRAALDDAVAGALVGARREGRTPLACDLGCGPGFFTILLTEMGFSVEAVDASEAMIARARENFAHKVPRGKAMFHECDLLSLPFADNSFDVCVSRNVTWLMRDPRRAYAEWLRVLRPGGKLVAYDANWYRYLVDEEVAAKRETDMRDNVLEGWDDDAQATSDEEKRCEELALSLPFTRILRPRWDLEALNDLGVAWCRADEGAWLRIWTPNEQAYYAATPMFMVEAVK